MRRLTADETFAVATIGAIAVFAELQTIPCNDIWWHLATGRIIATTHAIPTIEPFSYTQAGAAYFDQPWIAQLVFYATYVLGGAPLLLAESALALATTYALLCRLALRRSKEPRFAAWGLLLIAVALGIDNWAVRPQTLALPLFVLMLGMVSDAFRFVGTERGRGLVWLPPMMLLWVNLHGSFVLGLLVPGAALAGHLAQRMIRKTAPVVPLAQVCGCLALTLLASFMNPRGPAIYPYVRNMMTARAMVELNFESAPTTPFFLTGALFFLVAIVLAVLLVLERNRATFPTWSELAVVAFAFAQGLMVRRAILWFGFVATPLLVKLLAERIRSRAATDAGPDSREGSPVPLAVLGLIVVLTSPWVKPHMPLGPSARVLEDITPVAAVEKLNEERPRPAHIFNDEQFGSYLQFAAPEQKVFVDTRMDFYSYDLFQEYIRLSANKDVDALVQKWGIDAMLLDKSSQARLAKAVHGDPRWSVRYEDASSLLVVRAPSD